MIFTRNPELGKVKTRLAKTVGDQVALDIYKFLLQHTKTVTQDLECDKQVHYSVKVREGDIWDEPFFQKKQQQGEDLGTRMAHAFQEAFSEGYEKIVIIGSDLFDISAEDFELAFNSLDDHQVVIGPAEDGGYYLLGMTTFIPEVFQQKNWGTQTVLNDTLKDLQHYTYQLLEERNDVDLYEDIEGIEAFQQFINT